MRKSLLLLFVQGLFFLPLSAADYFWVGGSGDWSDISHWALTSGGTAFHNQAPTAADRVIFDANSFNGPGQVVTMNSETGFCLDMIWTDDVVGNPRLVGASDRILNIYGSLQLSAAMDYAFAGNVTFLASSPGHTIDLAGHTLLQSVRFSGIGGAWALTSGFAVDSLFYFEAGQLTTNDHPLRTNFLELRTAEGNAGIDFGRSAVTVAGSDVEIQFRYYVAVLLETWGTFYDLSAADLLFPAPNVTIEANTAEIAFGRMRFQAASGETRLNLQGGGIYQYQFLEINNNATINGSCRIDSLRLGPGRTFIFASGAFYEIGELDAQGSCVAPIQILASNPGVETTFQSNGSGITASYASIRDIRAQGSAVFSADNSADLGNNPGWTITPKANNELYWVGGTGMWNDPANWSFTSGGAGGACIPSAGDNVIFDANSFGGPGDMVMINVEDAYCQDMEWRDVTGAPMLVGTMEKNLHLFGSLQLSPDMDYQFEGDLEFEGQAQGNTIDMAGHLVLKDVTLKGTGSWILLDSLILEADINFIKGGFNTNDRKVAFRRFNGDFQNERTLELTGSLIQIRSPFTYVYFELSSTNLTLDAGTSTIEFLQGGRFDIRGDKSLDFHKLIDRQGYYYQSTGGVISFDTAVFYENADLNRSWNFRHMIVSRGKIYRVAFEDTLFVDMISAPAGCEGVIEFRSNIDDQVAYIVASQDNILSEIVVKDLHSVGAGTLEAVSSVDLGNNDGWVFAQRAGRDLYWVGDGGDWNDPGHWSLTSGGPGGECPPGPLDNVFFDANSFSQPNQFVNGSTGYRLYCRDLDWTAVTNSPEFNVFEINIFGSMLLSRNMEAYFSYVSMRSEEADNIYRQAGHRVWILHFGGSGAWSLEDSIQVNYFQFENGTLLANDSYLEFNDFTAYHANPKRIEMGASYWKFTGDQQRDFFQFSVSADAQLVVDPGTSTLEASAPHPEMSFWDTIALNKVLFSSETGFSLIANFLPNTALPIRYAEFRNDGTMEGSFALDTLIFSPGKSYILDSEGTVTVDTLLQMQGNNCTPIELSASSAGNRATIRMNSGVVKADFVQMRDQEAVGSIDFYAGVHSTNIGNSNTGWLFESAAAFEDEGFLGQDQVLCLNSQVILNADNSSPNETYLWQDGSMDSVLVVDQPGIYWAEVTFTNNCQIRDSVTVLPPEAFTAMLPEDTVICEGETLLLEAGLELVGMTYLWQDSSTQASFLVDAPGQYRLTLELSGCTSADSVNVEVQAFPSVALGSDTTLCPGQFLTLDAEFAGATYLWQDGSTSPTYSVSSAGAYTVEVALGRCVVSDALQVDYFAPIPLDLGPDTTVCEGDRVLFELSIPDAAYLWQDGITTAQYSATQPGAYSVTVEQYGCTAADTIQVIHNPLPRFSLGPDTSICTGATLTLDGSAANADSYLWNTGATGPVLAADTSITYELTAILAGCSFTDALTLGLQPLPEVDLGPAQQTICEGAETTFDATTPQGFYSWNTGSIDPVLTTAAAGIYAVAVTVNGCSASDSVELILQALPQLELGPDTVICFGEEIRLDPNSDADSFLWSTGSTSSQLTVSEEALYWVDASLNGCTRSDSVSVTVVQIPEDLLGDDRILCEGEVIDFVLPTPPSATRWQDGTQNNEYQVRAEGVYAVVVELAQCRGGDTINVLYNPTPIFDLGPDTALCAGETLQLSAYEGADVYFWSNNAATPSIVVDQPGQYGVVVTLDQCIYGDTVVVEFIDTPVPDLGPDTTICDDTPYLLTVNAQAESFIWQDGSSGPSYEVSEAGLYTMTIANGRCMTTDTVLINTRECALYQAYIPNVFSPNEDGINDTFKPFIPGNVLVQDYVFRIFDRWGNQLFETRDPDAAWDGSFRGQALPQGPYLYSLVFEYEDDYGTGTEEIAGEVTLIR